MNYLFILLPLLTAFTGWLCVRLPFMVLFRPRRARTIAGVRIQGVIPTLTERSAGHLGEYISTQVPLDQLEATINDPSNFEKIKPSIETHIDEFLRVKLKAQMPMIAMFIGEKTIVQMKTVFMEEIGNMFPQIIGQFAGNLKSQLNIAQLVSDRIRGLDLVQVEIAVKKAVARPLKAASMAGLGIGLIVGFVEALLAYLLVRG